MKSKQNFLILTRIKLLNHYFHCRNTEKYYQNTNHAIKNDKRLMQSKYQERNWKRAVVDYIRNCIFLRTLHYCYLENIKSFVAVSVQYRSADIATVLITALLDISLKNKLERLDVKSKIYPFPY